MNDVLSVFYWIISQTASWFSSIYVVPGVSLGAVMIAVIVSGLAAQYIVMSARYSNSEVSSKNVKRRYKTKKY